MSADVRIEPIPEGEEQPCEAVLGKLGRSARNDMRCSHSAKFLRWGCDGGGPFALCGKHARLRLVWVANRQGWGLKCLSRMGDAETAETGNAPSTKEEI